MPYLSDIYSPEPRKGIIEGTGIAIGAGIEDVKAAYGDIVAANEPAGSAAQAQAMRYAQERTEQANRDYQRSTLPGSISEVQSVGDVPRLVAGVLGRSAPDLAAITAASIATPGVGEAVGVARLGRMAARFAGGTAASTPMAAGRLLGEQREQSGEYDLTAATQLAVPYAALNMVGGAEALIARGLPRLAPGVIKNTIASTAGGMVGEGGAEYLQTGIEQVARRSVDASYDLLSPAAGAERLEAGLTGALVGGTIGAPAGVAGGFVQRRQAQSVGNNPAAPPQTQSPATGTGSPTAPLALPAPLLGLPNYAGEQLGGDTFYGTPGGEVATSANMATGVYQPQARLAPPAQRPMPGATIDPSGPTLYGATGQAPSPDRPFVQGAQPRNPGVVAPYDYRADEDRQLATTYAPAEDTTFDSAFAKATRTRFTVQQVQDQIAQAFGRKADGTLKRDPFASKLATAVAGAIGRNQPVIAARTIRDQRAALEGSSLSEATIAARTRALDIAQQVLDEYATRTQVAAEWAGKAPVTGKRGAKDAQARRQALQQLSQPLRIGDNVASEEAVEAEVPQLSMESLAAIVGEPDEEADPTPLPTTPAEAEVQAEVEAKAETQRLRKEIRDALEAGRLKPAQAKSMEQRLRQKKPGTTAAVRTWFETTMAKASTPKETSDEGKQGKLRAEGREGQQGRKAPVRQGRQGRNEGATFREEVASPADQLETAQAQGRVSPTMAEGLARGRNNAQQVAEVAAAARPAVPVAGRREIGEARQQKLDRLRTLAKENAVGGAVPDAFAERLAAAADQADPARRDRALAKIEADMEAAITKAEVGDAPRKPQTETPAARRERERDAAAKAERDRLKAEREKAEAKGRKSRPKNRVTGEEMPSLISPETRARTAGAVARRLRQLGLSRKAQVIITDVVSGREKALGAYQDGIIEVSAALGENAPFTLNHEIIHFLKEAGAITDAEWRILTAQARSNGKLMERIAKDYPLSEGFTLEDQLEEAVAEMFAEYAAQKAQPKGLAQQVWDRLMKLFRAIRDAMFDVGYETAEDIMQAVDEGRIAKRVQNAESMRLDGQRARMYQETNARLVSSAEQALKASGRLEGTPQQWVKVLQDAGVSKGELMWTGVLEALKNSNVSGKMSLTQVLGYVNAAMTAPGEVLYGVWNLDAASDAVAFEQAGELVTKARGLAARQPTFMSELIDEMSGMTGLNMDAIGEFLEMAPETSALSAESVWPDEDTDEVQLARGWLRDIGMRALDMTNRDLRRARELEAVGLVAIAAYRRQASSWDVIQQFVADAVQLSDDKMTEPSQYSEYSMAPKLAGARPLELVFTVPAPGGARYGGPHFVDYTDRSTGSYAGHLRATVFPNPRTGGVSFLLEEVQSDVLSDARKLEIAKERKDQLEPVVQQQPPGQNQMSVAKRVADNMGKLQTQLGRRLEQKPIPQMDDKSFAHLAVARALVEAVNQDANTFMWAGALTQMRRYYAEASALRWVVHKLSDEYVEIEPSTWTAILAKLQDSPASLSKLSEAVLKVDPEAEVNSYNSGSGFIFKREGLAKLMGVDTLSDEDVAALEAQASNGVIIPKLGGDLSAGYKPVYDQTIPNIVRKLTGQTPVYSETLGMWKVPLTPEFKAQARQQGIRRFRVAPSENPAAEPGVAAAISSWAANPGPQTLNALNTQWQKAKVGGRFTGRGALLSSLTLRQLAELYPSTGVGRYAEAMARAGASARKLVNEARDLLNKWNDLGTELADAVGDFLLDATVMNVNPLDPDGYAIDQEEEWQEMKDRFDAMPAAAQQVIRDVIGHFENARARKLAAFDAVAKEMGVSRDRVLQDLRGHANSGVRFYFPLMRFGKFAVTSMTSEFRELDAAYASLLDERNAERRAADKGALSEAAEKAWEERLKPAREAYEQGRSNGGYVFRMFDSVTEAQAWSDAERTAGRYTRVGLKKDWTTALDSVSRSFLSALEHRFERREDADQLMAIVREEFLRNLPDGSVLKREMRRQNVRGYNPDARRAFAAASERDAHYIGRMEVASQVQEALKDVEDWAEDENSFDASQLAATVREHHNAALTYTPTPIASRLTGVTYLWYLGANIAHWVTNAMQGLVVTAPKLMARFGGAALPQFQKAYRDVIPYMTKDGTLDFAKMMQDGAATAAEVDMLKELLDTGLIDLSQSVELAQAAMPTGGAESAFAAVSHYASLPGHVIEVTNRFAAALAGYRLESEQNPDLDPLGYAKEVVAQTHFDYSAENEPLIWKKYPLGRILLQFKKYQQGMLFLLGRNIGQALKGDREAAKLLVGLFTTHGIFAGAMGLPFMSLGFAVANGIQWAFGDDDEPWDARTEFLNFLARLMGQDDPDDVDTLFTALSRGVPAALGVDMSQRMGLHDIASISRVPQVDTDSPRQDAANLIVSLLGPGVGMVQNALAGLGYASEGEWQMATQAAMPNALKALFTAGKYASEGGLRELDRTLAIDDMNAAQLLAQAAGFSPVEVSMYFDRRKALTDYNDQITDRRKVLIRDYAAAKREGDYDTLSTAREDIKAFNATMKSKGLKPITEETLLRAKADRDRKDKVRSGGVAPARGQEELAELIAF